MKALVLTALALASAAAFARPDTLDMTCAQAAAYVSAKGSVSLSTGGQIWNRFYAPGKACAGSGERAQTAFAQTNDNNACYLGTVCNNDNNGGSGGGGIGNYVQRAAYQCNAGETRQGIHTSFDSNGRQTSTPVVMTCVNGSWKDPLAKPTYSKTGTCREGARTTGYETTLNSNGRYSERPVQIVCRNARWVKAN